MKGFHPENNLIPHTIDYYAQEDPDRVYAEYPRSPFTYDDGFTQVTYHSFANAINGIAWWLTDNLGPGDGETLAYVGTNDIRYPALVFGAIKAGYHMFLVSPRNSMPAYKSLFESTKCARILTQSPRLPPVLAIIDGLSMQAIDIPDVDELLSNEYPHFEYSKTYPDHRNDTMAIVHTSGSTGIPKPIIWPLEVANQHIRMSNLQPPSGSSALAEMFIDSKMFLTLPPFHAAGIGIMIFLAVPSKLTFVVPISASLPTAASFIAAAKQTDLKSAVLPPFILNDLAHNNEMLEFCSQHLELLLYGGGDLSQPIGEKIAKRIRLANMYGASELGIVNSLFSLTNRDHTTDWKYISPHPDLGGEFRHVMDDKYEFVLVRSEQSERHLMPFGIFPELTEYQTRDLFMRHPDPTKSELWRWCARVDDVIVFLNGEKTNPVSMEQHITASNKDVTGVLVAGAQRFQASLIIEYGDRALDPSERAIIIEKLWPSIEEANAVCPAHAQILRTHILFTVPEKPMSRAGKGTIQRTATLASYESELDALYADADSLGTVSIADDPFSPGRLKDVEELAVFIRQVLISVTGWSENQVDSATNFFHLGFDSLKAITATRSIRRGLRLSDFTPNFIYLYPSVTALSEATFQLMHNNEKLEDLAKAERLQGRQALFEKMIEHIEPNAGKLPQTQTVLLTGSTGTLGTYLLDALLKDPTVGHVHCLNRREDSQSVQHEKSTFFSLNSSFNSDKVSFLQVDLSQKHLGLDSEIFNNLRETATTIVHNAWNVNFNLSLASFEPDLLGVANLINFTASCKNVPSLFFISSVGSVLGHSTDSGLTPETLVTADPSANGYGNSKYVAEHMIAHAVKQGSIRASIARVGQVAGAVNAPGLWNKGEWFPSLVISSQQVGAIPQNLGPAVNQIDWVPIDLLSSVLIDLALNEYSVPGSVGFFHPLNLHPKTWEDIAPTVYEALTLSGGKVLEKIPLSDWIQRVRKNMEAASDEDGGSDEMLRKNLEKNPAAKLLDFFESLDSTPAQNALDTQNTAARSDKLRAIDGVKEKWIRKWIGEWIV